MLLHDRVCAKAAAKQSWVTHIAAGSCCRHCAAHLFELLPLKHRSVYVSSAVVQFGRATRFSQSDQATASRHRPITPFPVVGVEPGLTNAAA